MTAVREFPSVTLTDNSNLVQINTNDSNFSVVPGSVIFIAGDRPRVVTGGNTVNRTLTLAIAYTGNDIVEKSATLIPLGQNDALLSAITSLTEAQNGLAEAYGDGPGSVDEISWSVIIDPPATSTRWPDFTEITGDITGLQAIIDLVSDYESKDDSVREDLNARIDGIESTFATVYTASTSINALDHVDKLIITTSDAAVRVNLLDAPLDSEFSLVQEGQGIVTFHSPKTILNRQGFYKTAGRFSNAYCKVIEHDGDLHWAIFGDLAN